MRRPPMERPMLQPAERALILSFMRRCEGRPLVVAGTALRSGSSRVRVRRQDSEPPSLRRTRSQAMNLVLTDYDLKWG